MIGYYYIITKIPFIKNLKPSNQLLVEFILFITFLVIGLSLILLPSTKEQLCKNDWYIEQILYEGRNVQLNYFGEFILDNQEERFYGEEVSFGKDSVLVLPGLHSFNVKARWEMVDSKTIKISKISCENKNATQRWINKIDSIYSGIYKVEFYKNKMSMKSDKLGIYCRDYIF